MNRFERAILKHRILISFLVGLAMFSGYCLNDLLAWRPKTVKRVEFEVQLDNGIRVENIPNYMRAYPKETIKNIYALALNMFHEARGEPVDGIYAVGYVVMSRLRDPKFPKTVEKVVYQKDIKDGRVVYQFSWTGDDIPDTPREKDYDIWVKILKMAEVVYTDDAETFNPVKGYNYFARDFVINRRGTLGLKNVIERKKIGKHIFLKVKE